MEARITTIIRCDVRAMVMRGNLARRDLGGHVTSHASAAKIFEADFNHFFMGNVRQMARVSFSLVLRLRPPIAGWVI